LFPVQLNYEEFPPSVATPTAHFTVPPDSDGQRLDVVLARLVAETRSHIKTLIDEQRVWVEGIHKKAGYLVKSGEVIGVVLFPPTPIKAEPQDIPLDVLYEDEHLAAINKPPGMVVHPAPGQWSGTVVNALLFRWGWNEHTDNTRPGIVHRLDKDTSGVLLVAKNLQTLELLSRAFKERQVHKTYSAVVIGRPKNSAATITLPIGRHPVERKKMAVVPQGGREAVSRYQVMAEIKAVSLLRLFPETGRTHQLRVHLAAIGCPILGDILYGGNNSDLKGVDLSVQTFPRQALHAAEIEFLHPRTGQRLCIRAPYPPDFNRLLTVLRQTTEREKKLAFPVDGKKRIDYH
jgi:23S rRNA pseudouridine1911/1915/1917 synthase